MADDIDELNLDDLTELTVASAQNLLPEDDYGRGSDQWKRVRATAGLAIALNHNLSTADRDALPDTARSKKLERWAGIKGQTRKGATQASGEDAGLIRGEIGGAWLTTDALVHPASGRQYFPTSSGTLVAEEALVGIISEDTGSVTRLEAGDVLQWVSTPTDLEDEVELQADLDDGGLDQETEGALRNRVLDRFANPALGGTASDYEHWILESSDTIATGYVWPNRNGDGSVDIAGLKEGTGSARLLDTGERAALLAYVTELSPVSAEIRVLEVVVEDQNVEVHLTPRTGTQFAKDWNDEEPTEIDTWNSTTRTLTFTDDRPPSLSVGHRLVIEDTSGEEVVVESLVSTDAVVLVGPVAITPVAGSLVYSGGPIITPVRDRILELIDSLGPRQGDYGTGRWEGTLRLSTLFERVQTSDGVLDSDIITPTDNVEPTEDPFPLDDEIGLIVPGDTILVRYA